MRVEADFDKISTEYQQLPGGTYKCNIVDVEVGETKENKLPMLTFNLQTVEAVKQGDEEVPAGRTINDFVTLKNKDGKRNEIGLGRLKAYAIAVLGEEQANGGAIDTDALKGGQCLIIVKRETYTPKDSNEQKISSKIAKVLPVS